MIGTGELPNLHRGDSVSVMRSISAASVDLVLTDPPYNLGLFMKHRATNMAALRSNHFVGQSWDDDDFATWTQHMADFFEEAHRVLVKGGALLVFMAVIRVETLIELAQSAGFYYKTTGTWHKSNPIPRNMNLQFINSTESWVYFIKGTKTGVFNNDGKAIHDHVETAVTGLSEKRLGKHPTQKPVALMEHFVLLLTHPEGVVLDPFMGSGSSGVAAIRHGRKFIGVDIDKGHVKTARARISSELGRRSK